MYTKSIPNACNDMYNSLNVNKVYPLKVVWIVEANSVYI